MKFVVDVEDKLWRDLMKATAFPTDEEALKHILTTAFYAGDPNNISTKLILITNKVQVTKVTDPPKI